MEPRFETTTSKSAGLPTESVPGPTVSTRSEGPGIDMDIGRIPLDCWPISMVLAVRGRTSEGLDFPDVDGSVIGVASPVVEG